MGEAGDKSELAEKSPSEAIADAVMISYRKMLQDDLAEVQGGDINEVFKSSTTQKCHDSSLNVLEILATRDRRLFPRMLIITTHDLPRKKGQFILHTYFLVQDVNGYWTAGSPANHGLRGDKSYGTTVFRDKALDTVIKQISKRDKAEFPSAEEITEKLKYNNDLSVYGNQYQFLELDRVSHKVYVYHRSRFVK